METTKQQPQGGNPLGYAPIGGLIRKFAIPSIISMLVNAAYNITDQIFIGNVVGMLGNAATNVAFPVVMITTAFSNLVGIGTSANFNISMGAKREEDAKRFISNGLTMMSLIGVVLMCVVLLFKSQILRICGATDTVFPYANLYLSITAVGVPFLLFSGAASHMIRADGSPTYSMTCNVIGAGLNVFLDWLFMFVFDLGIQGAAIATVTSQIISFLFCLRYFTRFKTFQIKINMLGLQARYVIQIARLGASNFINHTIMMLVNIVMNNTLTHYGAQSIYGSDIPLAVSGVIAKLNSILSAFSIGVAHGCQPIWGFNMGAKNYKRVKETYKKALAFALCINVVSFLLFQLFPRQVVSIFGSGDELYFRFAEQYLRIFMLMVCVYGVQPCSINYFTGTGNMKQGVILSLSRQGFIMIPALIIMPMLFGLNGALYAGPVADSLACVLSLTLVLRNFKKLGEGETQKQ